jgi:hypothetical protein
MLPFLGRKAMLTFMNALGIGLITAATCILIGSSAQAQYKGPRDYFPKNNPSFPANAAQQGAGGAANKQPGAKAAPTAKTQPAQPAQPAKPQQPKFKDLPVNTEFYFLSDTNRTFAWTKLSASSAKNTKNGVTAAVNGEQPIQK